MIRCFLENAIVKGKEHQAKVATKPRKWCFQIVVLEKTLESSLDCKEIKSDNPKGNQPWIFIGRIDAKAETPTLWAPDAKCRLTEKDLDAGKDWRQEENRTAENEMVRWHHWLNGHEFEQTLKVGEGQGSLVCCSPGGRKEFNMIDWANNDNNSKQRNGRHENAWVDVRRSGGVLWLDYRVWMRYARKWRWRTQKSFHGIW